MTSFNSMSRRSLVAAVMLIGGCLGNDGRPLLPWPSSGASSTGGSSAAGGAPAQPGAGGAGGWGGFNGGSGGLSGLGGSGGVPVSYPDAAPAVDGPAPLPRPQAVLEACARRGQRQYLAGPALRTALVGRWLVCSDLGLFHRPQAGIELHADGRLNLLGWGAAGALVPLRGVNNEGDYYFVQEDRQLNLRSDLGGTVITFPELSSALRGLWINNIGAYRYDYVAADDVDLTGVEVEPTEGAPAGPPRAPGCERAPGSAQAVGTIPQMRQALVRRWVLCTADGLLGDGGSSEAGIEIEAGADRYHALSRDAAGQLVRSGVQAALEYIDTSSSNGRPTIQVNFGTNRGGTIISHPVITADPAYLIINNNGVREYRYVAAD